MPYVVVIYAPDRATATGIVEDTAGGRPVGVYRFPSKNDAECIGAGCGKEKMFGWGRHRDHGHIVHGHCQRRRAGFRRRIKVSLMDLFGYNLLPIDDTPAIFRNPRAEEFPDAYPSI